MATTLMIVVLLGTYIAILALFIWLKFIPFNTFWKISPLIVLLLLNIGHLSSLLAEFLQATLNGIAAMLRA